MKHWIAIDEYQPVESVTYRLLSAVNEFHSTEDPDPDSLKLQELVKKSAKTALELEELLPVLVYVLLYNKSEFCSKAIWLLLLEQAASSTHTAVLLSWCIESSPVSEEISFVSPWKKVDELLADLERVISEAELEPFRNKRGFIRDLQNLASWLSKQPKNERSVLLKSRLRQLELGQDASFFLYGPDNRVVNTVASETVVFNTAKNCPFMVWAEVLGTIERQPLSPKEPFERSTTVSENGERRKSVVDDLWMSLERTATGMSEFVMDGDPTAETSEDFFTAFAKFMDPTRGCSIFTRVDADSNGANSKKKTDTWEDINERVRIKSKLSRTELEWSVVPLIVKANDDLRQEQLGSLLVSMFHKIFIAQNVPVWLAPYRVIATGVDRGIIEPVKNTESIARLKSQNKYTSISQYFYDTFGEPGTAGFVAAQSNFVASLAGYSVLSFVMKLHDRHNGNILLDNEGHIIQIDFGFMLGKGHFFEMSPFKLTRDYLEILGGTDSLVFQDFRKLCEQSYLALHDNYEAPTLLVRTLANHCPYDCFVGGDSTLREFEERFKPKASKEECIAFINNLIDASVDNWSTNMYDRWQRAFNDIL
ncbi:hypothetical protein CYMTET_52274 [Cymbomonas tetramitiformis]|uniref:PI3K/PI4K catalytic domain-containing protein n=1 Tax=Cymbomonas tetramitiformis TaxID=36881 RepID=A0AAE0BL03_9CHLO|nr:hypothetical protein CYMTET_52274 [Cymbomonas tetramitiformis]|eukprot:gene13818-16328_t